MDKEVQSGVTEVQRYNWVHREVEKYCMHTMDRVLGEGTGEEGGATDNKGIHTWCHGGQQEQY